MTDAAPARVWGPDEAAAELRRRRVRRGILLMVSCAATGVVLYWVLGVAARWAAPEAPPGSWVIGPSRSIRLGAAWYGPVFIVAPFWSFLMRRWQLRDAGEGLVPPVEKAGIVARVFMWAVLAFFLAFVSFAVYGSLRAFDVVGPAGITAFRIPAPKVYSYAQVRAVEVRSDEPVAWGEGMACNVTFADASGLSIGTDNGLREEEVEEIASRIAERAGIKVLRIRRSGAGARP